MAEHSLTKKELKVAKAALELAICLLGGKTGTARAMGVNRQYLHTWKITPEWHCEKLCDLTDVKKEHLRPDVDWEGEGPKARWEGKNMPEHPPEETT